jgi:hypothetical protein
MEFINNLSIIGVDIMMSDYRTHADQELVV